MSNWDPFLDAARSGTLPTMLPPDLRLPMVAPADLGRAAARLLTEPLGQTDIHFVEGPERYTPGDVAEAFARALGRTVEPHVITRDKWEAAYADLGFSPPAAHSYAEMTALSVEGGSEMPASPERGSTTLQAYIDQLVEKAGP